jgi:hypothetical protein
LPKWFLYLGANMKAEDAIAQMVAPSMRRNSYEHGGILQIWVTRACDKACFGCTQGSNLGGKPGMITVEQYREAVASLEGYFGIVGMFWGNPAIHPQFDQLCRVLRESWVPVNQRGLWCNHPRGKGAICRETFSPQFSNLNVHLDREAAEEFARDWPEALPFVKGVDGDSRHSPVFVAMQDVIPDEGERWGLIAECDINRYWSAMVGVFRGELRAWFCEIAGAQAMLHQHEPDYPDTGLPLTPGWWRKPIEDYSQQIRYHCHRCGIPLRGRGELAIGGTREQVSKTHANIYTPKIKGREVEIVESLEQLGDRLPKATDYIENGACEIAAIIVAVDYDGELAVTLPHVRAQVDHVYVVTKEDATETRRIANENGCHVLSTDVWQEREAKFNKAGAIRLAQLYVQQTHPSAWQLLLDADIVIPSNLRHTVAALPNDDSVLYVAHRADFYDDAAIDAGKPSATYPPIAAGFFQLHRSNRLYADWSKSAQQCDLDFAASFPAVRLLSLTCCHLGRDGQNWEGRVTPAWNPRPLKVMK